MSWVRLDDGFPDHRKVEGLPDRAFRLHITALCHCARNLTDGVISRLALRSVGSNANLSRPGSTAKSLVTAGLWVAEGDGYRIHDYLKYNPSRADVLREREAARERMRRKRSEDVPPNGSGEGSGERSGTPTPSLGEASASTREGDEQEPPVPELTLAPALHAVADPLPPEENAKRAGDAVRLLTPPDREDSDEPTADELAERERRRAAAAARLHTQADDDIPLH